MIHSSLQIAGVEISSQQSPYIIAEISANHNGSIERAKETIAAAKNAGVNAVKIQSYTPETMTIDSNREDFLIKTGLWAGRSLFDLYGEAYTPFEWHHELFSFAKSLGITLFSSPFDESAVELLESLDAPAYKIASFEITDLPLIACVSRLGKPVLMSTGMASLDEVGDAVETAKSNGCNDIVLFHCISSYPAPLDQANINAIKILRREFGVEVGLSDHTIGTLASVVATVAGASVIEKHFTLSREDGGVDSAFSVEPDEMAQLVNDSKLAFSSLGSSSGLRSAVEESNRIFRRSLYFVKDVKEGDVITEDMVKRIRPGFGLAPKYYDKVINSECKKSAVRGDRVTLDHF